MKGCLCKKLSVLYAFHEENDLGKIAVTNSLEKSVDYDYIHAFLLMPLNKNLFQKLHLQPD